MSSERSQALKPALSLTNRNWCVVRSSTSGTGQPLPCSTTSIRQSGEAPATGSAASEVLPLAASISNISQTLPEYRVIMVEKRFS